MEKSIKMDQGMNPSPYYSKCCEMEDLMHEVSFALNRMERATDNMMEECVNNRGQASNAYAPIAADHMIQKLRQVMQAIG